MSKVFHSFAEYPCENFKVYKHTVRRARGQPHQIVIASSPFSVFRTHAATSPKCKINLASNIAWLPHSYANIHLIQVLPP